MAASAEFLYQHGHHLRETLIRLEGEDGAYRLLDHAAIKQRAGRETLLAAVQSTVTERRYLLVHYVVTDIGGNDEWHEATAAERQRLRVELRNLDPPAREIELMAAATAC